MQVSSVSSQFWQFPVGLSAKFNAVQGVVSYQEIAQDIINAVGGITVDGVISHIPEIMQKVGNVGGDANRRDTAVRTVQELLTQLNQNLHPDHATFQSNLIPSLVEKVIAAHNQQLDLNKNGVVKNGAIPSEGEIPSQQEIDLWTNEQANAMHVFQNGLTEESVVTALQVAMEAVEKIGSLATPERQQAAVDIVAKAASAAGASDELINTVIVPVIANAIAIIITASKGEYPWLNQLVEEGIEEVGPAVGQQQHENQAKNKCCGCFLL